MDHPIGLGFDWPMSVFRGLAFITAFASVVTGGSLFAFSTFVMPALDRLGGADAIKAMQSINLEAPRSLLMLPLIGSVVGCVAVGVLAVVRGEAPHRTVLLIGVGLGVIAFVITPGYHIPHNDALAKINPRSASAASDWVHYSRGWTRWNHARALAYLGSGVALVAAVNRRA